MKVLIVATEYGSGMMPFVSSIVNTLSKSPDFEVFGVFVSKGKNEYRGIIDEKVVRKSIFIKHPEKKIDSVRFKFYPLEVIEAIHKQIKKYNITHVHYLTVDYTLALYDFIFYRNKVERFFTVHDLNPHEQSHVSFLASIFQKYINWGAKRHILQKKYLNTSSKYQFEQLIELFPKKQIGFTPFPSLVTPKIQKGCLFPEELDNITDYILFFGNVDIYKGADLLYDAWSKLESRPPLVVAGKGLDIFKTNSSLKQFRLNRFISDEEVKQLFLRAKIIVYPYRSATMSGVLSLSYYFKKNILVSDVPFFLENIDKNAFVFKKGDKQDLQDKLQIALQAKTEIIPDFYLDHYDEINLINSFIKLYGLKGNVIK